MDLLSPAWLWLYAGAALMLAELVSPGFVAFFFGLAAATVAAAVAFLPEPFHPSATWQLALFSIFSVVYLVTLRRYVKSFFDGDSAESNVSRSEYIGRRGEITQTVSPDMPGRVMIGDAEWSAVAEDGSSIAAGTAVVVTGQDNLTLAVRALGGLDNSKEIKK